jgi:hypothetical protein
MKIVEFVDIDQITPFLERPAGNFGTFRQQVLPILEAVRTEGDVAPNWPLGQRLLRQRPLVPN